MQRSQRSLRWFASAWAAGAYLVLLRVPLYSGMRETMMPDGSRTVTAHSATLAAVNGPRAYVILAVPVLAAALALPPWSGRLRRAADIIAATIATTFVVLALWTVGAFFLPTAAALLVSASTKPTSRIPSRAS